MHEHVDLSCDHVLKFCKKCDIVYCEKCRLEWKRVTFDWQYATSADPWADRKLPKWSSLQDLNSQVIPCHCTH